MFDGILPDMPAAKFFVAFVIVLALIGLAAWLVRRFGANRLGGSGGRGRQPRLAVIDAASVDGRRRLVLIRRDNIEHLLMIGGPSDVVIEPNIVRAAASREMSREPARTPGDTLPRAVPLGDAGSWPLQPASEPPPVQVPASRNYRSAVTDEPWVASEPVSRARPADVAPPPVPDFSSKLDFGPPPARPAAPPPAPVVAPPVNPPVARDLPPAPAEAPPVPPQTDHNLAEMAQRLEAALRRPSAGDVHPPVTDPLAMPVSAPEIKAPEVKPPEPPRAAAREPVLPPEPRPPARESFMPPEPRAVPRDSFMPPEPRAAPRDSILPPEPPRASPREFAAPPPRPETKPAPAKSAYDSLEEEMTNLLGRPSGKT